MFSPTALRMAKTPYSFGRSECNRVKGNSYLYCDLLASLSNAALPERGLLLKERTTNDHYM